MTISALITAAEPDKADANIKAEWKSDCKVCWYKGREFICGVKGDAANEFPLVGNRRLHEPAYAENVFPMTIQSQDSFVIYDRTQKRFLVYNIATCLKGKDQDNNEKTDWVGEIKPAANKWDGDIMVIRKYDKKGPGMRAPYYSMGRNFPFIVNSDGSCIAQYNYFGDLKLDLVSREIPDKMLQRIVDDHDKHYHEAEDRH